MVDNPLFYRSIGMLNRDTHKDFKVVTDATRFSFAAGTHIIPALVDEFVPGGRALPIVFIPGPTRPTPVFLVGLSPGHNRFVDGEGRWTADYVPAFVRRYPFIIGEVENASPLICVDETSSLLSKTEGEPLFLSDGEQSPLLKNTVLFVGEYMAAAKRTETFIDLLQKFGLFRTITIDVRTGADASNTVHGMMTVDQSKFNTMPDADFLTLRTNAALVQIFAHLSSLQLIDKVANAAAAPSKADATADLDTEPTEGRKTDAHASHSANRRRQSN